MDDRGAGGAFDDFLDEGGVVINALVESLGSDAGLSRDDADDFELDGFVVVDVLKVGFVAGHVFVDTVFVVVFVEVARDDDAKVWV